MKYLFFLLFVFSFQASISQVPGTIFPIDEATGLVTYQHVYEQEGFSKDNLYIAAREWFVMNFKSADDVIQLDEKTDGLIIAKGYRRVTAPRLDTRLYFTLKIEVKDSRFRVTFDHLFIRDFPSQINFNNPIDYTMEAMLAEKIEKTGKKRYDRIVYLEEQMDRAINGMIEQLGMSVNSLAKKTTSDW